MHFSSKTPEWSTPRWFYKGVDAEFGFTLDPCSTHENCFCPRHFTIAEDGLKQDWTNDIVFMNPPYGREIGRWVKKAYESAKCGATVVCLLPPRADTRWFHRYVMSAERRFLRGRLKFGDSRNAAPFPSMVAVFRPPTPKTVRVKRNGYEHERSRT